LKKKSLISICIPNYNNAKYLEKCIQSALNINYENKEIILVDDNSSDNSLEIAESFSSSIKIFKNETNIGQAKNTNKSISLSKGDFIVILHSDDQLLSNFGEKLVPLLENNDNIIMAIGERKETDENEKIVSITPFYNTDCFIEGEKQAKVFMMMSFLPCQVLFRRDTFIKSGQVNEKHIVNLDGLLWFQLSLLGDVAYIQEEVCIYRIHAENTTSKYNKTINHMMEYYITLSEMFKLAQGREYLEGFFKIAEERVASLTLRYCTDVIKNKDFDLAKQYLRLSKVFDPNIINNELYIKLEDFLLNERFEGYDDFCKVITNMKKRNHSYDPPLGFKKIGRI
jgi:glycosyltransferase involved in cell wall biosynthesis